MVDWPARVSSQLLMTVYLVGTALTTIRPVGHYANVRGTNVFGTYWGESNTGWAVRDGHGSPASVNPSFYRLQVISRVEVDGRSTEFARYWESGWYAAMGALRT